jgi:hypothetical protein
MPLIRLGLKGDLPGFRFRADSVRAAGRRLLADKDELIRKGILKHAWQCYKEPSWASRALWLLALVLLGNIAMAVYGLLVTFRLPPNAGAAHVLLRRAPMSPLVPAALVMIIAGVGAVTAFL